MSKAIMIPDPVGVKRSLCRTQQECFFVLLEIKLQIFMGMGLGLGLCLFIVWDTW
jgi:hypothetical protein